MTNRRGNNNVLRMVMVRMMYVIPGNVLKCYQTKRQPTGQELRKSSEVSEGKKESKSYNNMCTHVIIKLTAK